MKSDIDSEIIIHENRMAIIELQEKAGIKSGFNKEQTINGIKSFETLRKQARGSYYQNRWTP